MPEKAVAVMPIEFQTSLDLDLVYTRWWGDVSMDEFRRTFASYTSDAYYRPGRTELTDFTEVGEVDANFSSIWSVLNMVNDQAPGRVVQTRTLLIAPDDMIYGLARIYKTLADNADGIQVELYRSRAEALAALGHGFPTLDALFAAGNFLPHTPVARDGYGA